MKRLVSYIDPEDVSLPIRLVFEDGKEATCDVLVGADGVKSAVRARMLNELAGRMDDEAQAEKLRECIPPRFSGAMTFRAIIPREKLTEISPESPVWTAGSIVRHLCISPLLLPTRFATVLRPGNGQFYCLQHAEYSNDVSMLTRRSSPTLFRKVDC